MLKTVAILKTLLEQIKILTISYLPPIMQIVKMSIFATRVISLFRPNIANKFNEYFTDIGPDLASLIDTSNKAPFDSYLNTPCSNSFLFQYTSPTDITKMICQLKPQSGAGYNNISSKLCY